MKGEHSQCTATLRTVNQSGRIPCQNAAWYSGRCLPGSLPPTLTNLSVSRSARPHNTPRLSSLDGHPRTPSPRSHHPCSPPRHVFCNNYEHFLRGQVFRNPVRNQSSLSGSLPSAVKRPSTRSSFSQVFGLFVCHLLDLFASCCCDPFSCIYTRLLLFFLLL